MNRPDNCNRIHFSCDGSIALINLVPFAMIRAGDTASGGNPADGGKLWLFRCEAAEDRIGQWRPIETWNERSAQQLVRDADMLAVVSNRGILSSGRAVQPS